MLPLLELNMSQPSCLSPASFCPTQLVDTRCSPSSQTAKSLQVCRATANGCGTIARLCIIPPFQDEHLHFAVLLLDSVEALVSDFVARRHL